MRLRTPTVFLILFLLASFAGPGIAKAVPILQLYLEGGTYNTETQSWELTPAGSSAGEPFRLWAIGNIEGPGGKGLIEDVKLSAAFSREAYDAGLRISSITPTTTGGFGGFFDTELPQVVDIDTEIFTNGEIPQLGDGTDLPTHGIYGPGTDTVWQQFQLGDFSQADAPIGDFIGAFPTLPENAPAEAQINVYEISVVNGHGYTVHFDLYDTVVAKNDARFAPFSHDADGDANVAPEPSSFGIWLLFAALFGILLNRKRRLCAS